MIDYCVFSLCCWFYSVSTEMGFSSSLRAHCKFSHDTDSEHNKAVLKAHENYGFNDDGLKVLLLQNDHSLLPEVRELEDEFANNEQNSYSTSISSIWCNLPVTF
ncbi:hypothetical protein XELAEV_18000127mg [Xenopus laevis]|uniref:Uncharacterized protein n=1 Tax=Xenopus laevis TaxID=8355 RepID=A0A974GYM7_XENLA|nr:hypothetical protein XELAEV_18000127mg [Xenopus laevis]